jgi:hypothetical protein
MNAFCTHFLKFKILYLYIYIHIFQNAQIICTDIQRKTIVKAHIKLITVIRMSWVGKRRRRFIRSILIKECIHTFV